MNVDEAMEAAAEFRADMETRPAWTLFSENVAVVLSFEVERLRAELAAAKAASECPVEVLNILEVACESDRYIELRTDAEADKFEDWLRDRIKDTTPPAT